jgi:predicted permease
VIARIRSRLRALIDRRAVDREMREEMALHLERATERLMGRGMSRREAELEARREFGNVATLQEQGRDARGGRWIDALLADVRFALRHFARRPLLAATVVFVLMLGIGVNTALFSLIQAITLRPAPGVPAHEALVRIRATDRTSNGRPSLRGMSLPEVTDLAARRDVFASVAAWSTETVVVSASDSTGAKTAFAQFVTPNYFTTLGVSASVGQTFAPTTGDDGAVVAVLSERLWRHAFAGTPDVVGRVIRVNGVAVRIIGIGAPRLQSAVQGSGYPTIWMPISARASIVGGTSAALANRDSLLFQTIARLQPGVSVERADAQARQVVTAALSHVAPRQGVAASEVKVLRLEGNTEDIHGNNRLATAILGVGALLILLVACTNVSALLVGAAVARRQEIAVRLSLGASRTRIVRQLLTETWLLAIAGGALGVAMYWGITRVIEAQMVDVELAPDWITVVYTALFAVATGVVFGLSPALHATRRGVAEVLKDTTAASTGGSRLQRGFIVAQIAFTQPLLAVLALLIGAVMADGGARMPREQSERIIRAQFDEWSGGLAGREREASLRAFSDRVAAMPGVVRVFPEPSGFNIFRVAAHPADAGSQGGAAVNDRIILEGTPPGYFGLLGIPILRGRDVAWSDTARSGHQVVIGNELARRLWGSADPIGKRIVATRLNGEPAGSDVEVVGVFDSERSTSRGDSENRLYTARSGGLPPSRFLIVTSGPASPLIPTIQTLAIREFPRYPLQTIQTIAQEEEVSAKETLQIGGAAGGAGALALLLACIGLYGAVSLAVGQRRREIAVRMALGARAQQVVAMFFSRGLRTSLLGLVLGLPASMVGIRMLESQLVGPPVSMWGAGAVIGLAVLAVASFATWLPSRRAAKIDPMVALRTD